VTAYIMGTLVKGLGTDHVLWGTDALWTGSPQWQIEGLRRLEIPADMQKQHGFKPLGAADGPVKTAIFGGNVARLYNYPIRSFLERPTASPRSKPSTRRPAPNAATCDTATSESPLKGTNYPLKSGILIPLPRLGCLYYDMAV
jgi:hypothetical protein